MGSRAADDERNGRSMNYEAELLYRPTSAELRFLPEGPMPMGDDCLSWVAIQHGPDMEYGSLNILRADGVNTNHPLTGRPGFAFPAADGQSFLLGMERIVQRLDLATMQLETLR